MTRQSPDTTWRPVRPAEVERPSPQRQRIDRYFECDWRSDWGQEKTCISSISPTGCYVDSRFMVPPEGTHVREIRISLPDGCVTLNGTVLQATPGVGFSVRFAEVDDARRARLEDLVGARHSQ